MKHRTLLSGTSRYPRRLGFHGMSGLGALGKREEIERYMGIDLELSPESDSPRTIGISPTGLLVGVASAVIFAKMRGGPREGPFADIAQSAIGFIGGIAAFNGISYLREQGW